MTDKTRNKTDSFLKKKNIFEKFRDFFVKKILFNNLVWGIFTFFILLVLLGPEIKITESEYKIGDIARSAIRAKADITVEDRSSLEDRRKLAIENLPPVYDYFIGRGAEDIDTVIRYFGRGRTVLNNFLTEKNFPDIRAFMQHESFKTLRSQLISNLRKELPLKTNNELLAYHVEKSFDKALQDSSIELIKRITRFSLVPTEDDVARIGKNGFLKSIGEGEFEQYKPVTDTSDVKSIQKSSSVIYLQSQDMTMPALDKMYLRKFVAIVVRPNLELNPRRTKDEEIKTASEIEPVYYRIKKGEVIVREGDIIDGITLFKINGIRQESSKFSAFLNIAGLAIFLVCFLIAIKAYTVFFVYRYVKIENLFILFNSILVFQLILLKISFFIAETVGTHFLLNPFNKIESYFYAMPFAAGPVLLTSLSNQLIAIMLALSIGGFTGILTDGNFYVALFSIISSLAGIYGIRHYRERSAFMKAAMIVSLVNVISIIAINLITGEFELVVFFFEIFLGFIGGFLIAFFASFLAPVLESAFGIATDIKLLELSSADRDLLRQLTIEAPGTYQHSVMVGILAEAAAAEIRANALFCRVAALYHDIGKLAKPDYFVENNTNAPKLHRKQKPHMSALIIVNHVKKGIQLAKENKLPQTIIDIIPQHHGTRLIGSFYQLAKEQSDPTIEVINEEDFRYPGPKPQTKEAAMIMIADTVEAASRSLENPTPHKISSVVEDLVNHIFLDGQLDECQLTFIELRRSTEAIIKKITAIFHGRIEYPQFQFNKPAEETKGAPAQNGKSS